MALLRDRRGVTSLAFAASAMILVGAAALATDAGLLYAARRQAQQAADMAALAGVHASRELTGAAAGASASTAGRDVSGRNGIAHGGANNVDLATPPGTGRFAGDATAVSATVSQQVPARLSGAFLGRNDMTVAARAVARLERDRAVCLLGLTQLRITSGNNYELVGCGGHSNGTGANSVQIQNLGGGGLRALGMSAVGTCSGCDRNNIRLESPAQSQAPSVPNPFAHLDGILATGLQNGTTIARDEVRVLTSSTFRPGVYRGQSASGLGLDRYPTIRITESNWVMPSGTYYFENVSLSLEGMTNVRCDSCTFVFTGTAPGGLNIMNTTNIRLIAAEVNAASPDLDGMLIVRTPAGIAGDQSRPGVHISGNTNMGLSGGQYFGQSYTRFHNNSNASIPLCNAMTSAIIEISSGTNQRIDVTDCPRFGNPIPWTMVPRLVE